MNNVLESNGFSEMNENELGMVDGGRSGGSLIGDLGYAVGNNVGSSVRKFKSDVRAFKCVANHLMEKAVHHIISGLPGHSI